MPPESDDGGGPQRVVRRRDQHFVAAVEQRLHGLHDQFRDAVAEVDVLNGHVTHAARLVVLHDRFARGEQAFGIAVALRGGQVADHVHQDFVRRFETERRRVADVQLEDFVAFFFKAFGVFEHRAANVIADVVELAGFLNGGHKKLSLLLG